MSRETQYIGLTKAAADFVAECEGMPSDSCTYGMFEEEVPLRMWKMHPVLDNIEGRNMVIREVVQEVPCSSGPMIFTCLEFDWDNGGKELAYEWIHDPTLSREFCQHHEELKWMEHRGHEPCRVTITHGKEYDREKGTMWV